MASILLDNATSAPRRRTIALWIFAAAVVVTAVAVLVADSSLTPEQRIAVFMQAGMFP